MATVVPSILNGFSSYLQVMDDPDNLTDVNHHILSGNDLENHVNTNGTERTGYGDDEVEIVVCSVTSDTETASIGESPALDTPLNSYKFDIDGTVYTFIVDLEASLKKDDSNKDGHHEEKVLPTKDDLRPNAIEQYRSLLSMADSQQRDSVAKDIDSKEQEDLPLNGESSLSETEEDHFDDSVTRENEQAEEVMSVQDNLNCVNGNSVTLENEKLEELLNAAGNSLTSGRTWNDLPGNDDADIIVNEWERTNLIAQENSVSSLIEQEEKCVDLKEIIGVYDDKKNDARVATPENEPPVHLISKTKKQDYDPFINIQKKSKKYNRKPRDKHICKTCDKHFASSESLRCHLYLHKSDRPSFACNHCSRAFSRKRNLTRHMRTCKGNKNMSGKYELRRYMHIHSNFEQLVCDICMRTFSQKDSLTKHIKDHYRLDNFDFKICLIQFSNESSLIHHMRDHTDRNHTKLDKVTKLGKQQDQNKRDLYSCDLCLQSFSRKANLGKHMELDCRLNNLSCEICYEEYSDQSTLNRHMAIHLLAKDDSIPCVYEQDKSLSSVAKSNSMSNVNEYDEDNLLSCVEEHERKDMGVKYDSVLSVVSQEEKLSLVDEIVNGLKGKTEQSSENEVGTIIGNLITSIKNEKLEYIKTEDDSVTSGNHPKREVWQIKENMILSVFERTENTNDLLTVVKDKQIETSNAMETSGSNLITEEGKVLVFENEQSVKDENEQDSNKATQDFTFPIYNLPSVIKKEKSSVSKIQVQTKLNRHKRKPLECYQCEICCKRFSSALCLKRHSVLHQPDPPSFTCKICPQIVTTKGSLLKHMKVHGICGFCWKQYSQRKDLDLHMRTVHSTKPQPYFCDLCSQTFLSRYYLVRHIEDHVRVGKFICKFCSIQCPNKYSLSHHMHVHLDGDSLERQKDKRQSFYCDACSQSFDCKGSLGIHMKQRHRLDKQSCPVCEKQFSSSVNLNHHMSSVHIDKRQTLLYDICPKGFSSQKHLTKHRRNHFRHGFIHCKVCSKQFRDTAGLKRHMITHLSSDQSKLYCYQCLQQFDTISDYTVHMHQHEGSHTCAICSQVFGFKSNLKRHVMKYHFKIGLLYCKICGKGSQNKTDLSRHMIAKHSGHT